MLTFEGFVPGAELGVHETMLDAEGAARWCALFPGDAEVLPNMPPGMSAAVIMRAYTAVVTPRPPGNVHGEQVVDMHHLPRLGDLLRTRFVCEGKELKKDRRWVKLASETTNERGELLFTGRMVILWAA